MISKIQQISIKKHLDVNYSNSGHKLSKKPKQYMQNNLVLGFSFQFKPIIHVQYIISIYQPQLSKEVMGERKIWKIEEDRILKELFEEKKIKKWSEISKIMNVTYGIEGRNGKQCRERYHNHLKCGINKDKWTVQEENQLIELHAIYGNRWALISKLVQGRTENCVKNMLYSRMRRSIRQLNRFSFLYYRRIIKQIKISFIYRLIDFTQRCYAKTVDQRTVQQNKALGLKNSILVNNYNQNDELSLDEKEKIKQLIQDIHTFKRQNQRYRGSNLTKKSRRKEPNQNNKSQYNQDKPNDQSLSKQVKQTEEHDIQSEKDQIQKNFDLMSMKTKVGQQVNISEIPIVNIQSTQNNADNNLMEPIFLQKPIYIQQLQKIIPSSESIDIVGGQLGDNINVWSNYIDFLEQ